MLNNILVSLSPGGLSAWAGRIGSMLDPYSSLFKRLQIGERLSHGRAFLQPNGLRLVSTTCALGGTAMSGWHAIQLRLVRKMSKDIANQEPYVSRWTDDLCNEHTGFCGASPDFAARPNKTVDQANSLLTEMEVAAGELVNSGTTPHSQLKSVIQGFAALSSRLKEKKATQQRDLDSIKDQLREILSPLRASLGTLSRSDDTPRRAKAHAFVLLLERQVFGNPQEVINPLIEVNTSADLAAKIAVIQQRLATETEKVPTEKIQIDQLGVAVNQGITEIEKEFDDYLFKVGCTAPLQQKVIEQAHTYCKAVREALSKITDSDCEAEIGAIQKALLSDREIPTVDDLPAALGNLESKVEALQRKLRSKSSWWNALSFFGFPLPVNPVSLQARRDFRSHVKALDGVLEKEAQRLRDAIVSAGGERYCAGIDTLLLEIQTASRKDPEIRVQAEGRAAAKQQLRDHFDSLSQKLHTVFAETGEQMRAEARSSIASVLSELRNDGEDLLANLDRLLTDTRQLGVEQYLNKRLRRDEGTLLRDEGGFIEESDADIQQHLKELCVALVAANQDLHARETAVKATLGRLEKNRKASIWIPALIAVFGLGMTFKLTRGVFNCSLKSTQIRP